jgi:2-methylcitrate dehydratase
MQAFRPTTTSRLARPVARAFASYHQPTTPATSAEATTLPADSNQAHGIANYAIDFMNGTSSPDPAVWKRVKQFHTDSVMCGLSALAYKTNAPTVLRAEALEYSTANGATCFGSSELVQPEKAICANSAAVREWDSNGTVFGFNPAYPGHDAGEFGHNNFYPVAVAAAQQTGQDGNTALRAMILSDEIRGRLAEVFSLKQYKIDHVVHGAIASAASYGAMMGATPEQIESAIGMVVAHYIPFRAIRAGKQLSDSKGSSAAISTEAAILCMRRAMRGFVGPKDIFRNPEAIWRFFEPTTGVAANKDLIDLTLSNKVRWGPGPSPFNLVLSHSGSDFAVMGMHFKLGLYEHQSAGAIQGMKTLLYQNPDLLKDPDAISNINIKCYEPAFGIIGDPAKMNPTTRQSADHSMAYIISTVLRKAIAVGADNFPREEYDTWATLMLAPEDYGHEALYNAETRALMQKITFTHGGDKYDNDYPEGIPTSMTITTANGKSFDSGYVMYPPGQSRNTSMDLDKILDHKNRMLGKIAVEDVEGCISKLDGLEGASADDVKTVYSIPFRTDLPCIDE